MQKMKPWTRAALIGLLAALSYSCSPYAGVSVGVPFNVGPFYGSTSIGVGGFL